MDWRLFWISDVDSSKKLKILRKKINWENPIERYEFHSQFCDLIRDWKGELPDLQDIFRSVEIDWLLMESVNTERQKEYDFIDFVISCGYKDEPEIDRNGKPVTRRTTPIHLAGVCGCHHQVIHDLFKIYNRFDVNYTCELGVTHFHVACEFGLDDVAKKFLELGRVDPNYAWLRTGKPLLHLALRSERKKIFELLLRGGADPNLADRAGSTPLHILCTKTMPNYKSESCADCDDDSDDGSDDSGVHDDYMADLLNKFFMINDDKNQPVQIDARDNDGNTPLRLAVKNLSLKIVGVLLDRGADPSDFVFPLPSPYQDASKFNLENGPNGYKLRIASRVLAIVESLEARGYQLGANSSNVATIFVEYELFRKSPMSVRERWCRDEDFAEKAKKIILNKPSELSLYDFFFKLPRREAEKLFAYSDYYDFWRSTKIFSGLEREHTIACVDDMCEIMSRGFFRRWALDSFVELTRHRLLAECCEMIIDELTYQDLLNICLAAADQSSTPQ